jgi:cell division protein FtsB
MRRHDVEQTDLRTLGLARRQRYERWRRMVRLALLFAALALLANAIAGDNGLTTLFHTRREYQELQAEVERLRAETTDLRDQARRLREDPAAIEELARRELGLVKPGEQLIVIVPK